MVGMLRAVMMVGVAAAALTLAGKTAMAAPVEAYGRLPAISDVRLSPDASHIAYIGMTKDDLVVSILSRDGAKPPVLLRVGRAKLRDLQWADDGHLVVTTSTADSTPIGVHFAASREYLHAFLYDLASGGTTHIEPPGQTGALNAVMSTPVIRTVDGRKALFFKSTTPHEQRAVPTLFRMDVASGAVRQLDQGALTERDFVVSSAGEEIAQSFFADGRWTVKVKTASGWQTTALDARIDVPSFAGLGPSGDTVLIGNAPSGDDMRGLREVSLKTGAWAEQALHGAILHDPQTGRALVDRVMTDARTTYSFFDPAMQAHWNAILKAFPGEQVDFESVSADRNVFVVQVFGPTTGAAYMLIDLSTGKGELIGDVYAGLTPAEVAVTTPIRYAAADGLIIPAYLTTPKGREAKNLPLVVLPHGAVAGHDSLAFDWMVQALASRGYAVLQPQFRGSDGFGEAFRERGFGEWAGKMRTDLSDGVRYLAAQGVADPRRVCIVGGNYGGYAALAGAALESDVYRCAVSIGGITDLNRLLAWQKEKAFTNYSAAVPYLERYMGPAAASPVSLAGQVSIPVLLIHGRDDTTVPFNQAQSMADALQAAHKSVQLIALPGEDHWLSRSDTRLQALQATLQFLQANNPADPIGAGSRVAEAAR
jgi:dipeptidyl aminopeptidase/acylaminoacyl peptidase